jgi:hypothetical protein
MKKVKNDNIKRRGPFEVQYNMQTKRNKPRIKKAKNLRA